MWPILEDGELLVWVPHFDGAGKVGVGEGVDDVEFFVVGSGALVGVEGEFEGAG